MVRAFTVFQLPLGIEPFTTVTIQPGVFGEINISVIVYFLKHLIDHRHMRRVGGTDKPVMGDIQLRPQATKQGTNVVHIGFGAYPLFFSGADNLVTVLVRPGEKKGLFPAHGIESSGHIRHNGRIGMT